MDSVSLADCLLRAWYHHLLAAILEYADSLCEAETRMHRLYGTRSPSKLCRRADWCGEETWTRRSGRPRDRANRITWT